ncbi:ScbA/BarX family gamma-butyrolactone biosynthesis protein [Streptomyces sp. CC208A]|uniref:ScbA/BarX family gamma-butyrolactone biosynthesis protein n=1 Tax=Streptomyces sp. CC208A TaxID=3044573 RepID=UPI0024A9F2D2|nr:ScbA/BarX family gamma-butyrolactone biosynthesis protein [Streptomyces sp. CC208A]
MPSLDHDLDETALPFAPVPQALTHKLNAAEVLLTDWRRTAPDTFAVRARWPRAHGFYLNRHGRHDPLLLAESVRQALPLLSHAAYAVPMGHQLLWQDFRWELDPVALYAEGRAVDVELSVVCDDVRYRRGRAAAMVLRAEAYREGTWLGRARTQFTIQDRAIYERLRGAYADTARAVARARPAPPPVPPQLTGRYWGEDVVLSAVEAVEAVPVEALPVGAVHPAGDGVDRWGLRVDTSHPVLFDHPVDHVPGMLLMEAARQAAQAAAHPRATVVVGMETSFVRYVELDAPCRIETRPLPDGTAGRRRVLVTALQHGEEVFSDVVTLADA